MSAASERLQKWAEDAKDVLDAADYPKEGCECATCNLRRAARRLVASFPQEKP